MVGITGHHVGANSRNFDLATHLIMLAVFPLIFHSIQDEIPEASRPLITRMYQLWLLLVGTLLVNMVACILILLSGSPDGGRDLGASIGYVHTFNGVYVRTLMTPHGVGMCSPSPSHPSFSGIGTCSW